MTGIPDVVSSLRCCKSRIAVISISAIDSLRNVAIEVQFLGFWHNFSHMMLFIDIIEDSHVGIAPVPLGLMTTPFSLEQLYHD